MKQSKKDVALNERDSLQDMLDTEKLLSGYYGAALSEGSSQSFRREILKHYSLQSETQLIVFEQMLSREYCAAEPVRRETLQEKRDVFGKIKKQISSAE